MTGMSASIEFFGKDTYQFSLAPGTTPSVTITAEEIANTGTSASGSVRLEMWLTAAPWNPKVSNTGYEIAIAQLGGTTNGTIAAGASVKNVSLMSSTIRVRFRGSSRLAPTAASSQATSRCRA
jgi:hypothetical protein